MLNLFSDLKTLIKLGSISIDNFVFKLHYKITVIVLLSFSILVNTRQFFGDPIDCTKQNEEIKDIIDTYCWFNAYNLIDADGNVYIQAHKDFEKNPPFDLSSKQKVYQTFYQWIGIVLLIQAGLFYFPRFMWKVLWEEGRVKELVNGLTTHIQDSDDFSKREAAVIEYIQNNKGHHLTYVMKFFFCEAMNFFNVILQIFITDRFLGHAFINYGVEWLWADEGKMHPSYRYFPKETHCDIQWGSPGIAHPNRYHALCVLPIQVFNEKIYLFLWFYFIALAIISGIVLIYRVIVMLSPQVRLYMLSRRSWAVDPRILKNIVDELDTGDWFLIYQMRKNMDAYVFGKLIRAMDADLKKNDNLSFVQSERGGNDLVLNYSLDDKENHFKSTDRMMP